MSDDTSTSHDTSTQESAQDSGRGTPAAGGGRLRNFGIAFIAASAILVILAFILENSMAA